MDRNITSEMEKWVNTDTLPTFREICIQGHCHGVRVTLKEEFKRVVSAVEPTVDEAYKECMRSYENAAQRIKQEEREFLKRRRSELKSELSDLDCRLKKLL